LPERGDPHHLHQGTFYTAASAGLSASTTTLVLDSANASATKAITFSWPVVNFGDNVLVSYTLQLDSVAGNFAKPVSVPLGSGLSQSYTKADFNALPSRWG